MTIKALTIKDLLYEENELMKVQKDFLKNAYNSTTDSEKAEFLKKAEIIDYKLELIRDFMSKLLVD